MLTGIRKLNVVPLRLTALVLLTVVIVTLLVACASSDEEDRSPNLTIQPDPDFRPRPDYFNTFGQCFQFDGRGYFYTECHGY